MVQGLSKKDLVRGLNTPDAFEKKEGKEDSNEAKKVGQLIQNWRDSMGSNDNWACKYFFPFEKY